MKAQLSFEFLIYVAISAVSLVGMLAVYLKGNAIYVNVENRSYAELLVAAINNHLGYFSSNFTAYVPKGVCANPVNGTLLEYDNATYSFSGDVRLSGSLCDGNGGLEYVTVTRLDNGTFVVD